MNGQTPPEMRAMRNAAPSAICPMCGDRFPVKRDWTRFCSTRCRQAYHRAEPPLKQLEDLKARIARLEELIQDMPGYANAWAKRAP